MLSQALAVRWFHLDGHLTRWTAAALSEHLLTYVPRMALRPGEDWSDVPVGLIAFIRFLDAERLLAPGSDRPDVLEAGVVELVGDLVAAMDAAQPGGLALPDPHDLLVADVPPPVPGAVLPRIDLLSDERAAEAARATAAVRSLVTFLGWLGGRRRLTSAGNLRQRAQTPSRSGSDSWRCRCPRCGRRRWSAPSEARWPCAIHRGPRRLVAGCAA